MHTLYNVEQWRQHHNALLREAEHRRLAQQLRRARSGSTSRAKDMLLKATSLWSSRNAKTAEC